MEFYKLIDKMEPDELSELRIEEMNFWKRNERIYTYASMGLPHRRLLKAMEKLIEPKENDKWLILGSGRKAPEAKLIWKKSNESVEEIHAIDLIFEKEEVSEEIPILRLRFGSIGEHLDFPDKYFDGIISNIAIPYTIDWEGISGKDGMEMIFKEIARILKPGGQLVWSTPKENMHLIVCVLAAIPDIIRHPKLILVAHKFLEYVKELKRKGKKGVYTYLKKEEWENILTEAGFINHEWKSIFSHQAIANKSILAPIS